MAAPLHCLWPLHDQHIQVSLCFPAHSSDMKLYGMARLQHYDAQVVQSPVQCASYYGMP